MRILRILLIFLFIPFTASAQFYVTGDDPGRLKWNYIDTESYRVIYPQGADSLAESYARKLEKYKIPINRPQNMRFVFMVFPITNPPIRQDTM